MSITKCKDVAYVRFAAPDLDKMHKFLSDFGLVTVSKTDSKIVVRTHGELPVAHITELGEPGFKGFGIWVDTEEDLKALAEHDNVPVEDLNEPGGGKVARLTDPDGFIVEAITGFEKVAPLPVERHDEWNQAGKYPRLSQERKETNSPSHPMRLGHVVLNVGNFRKSEAWYKERFGFITSDEIQPESGEAIGAFMRCDRGEEPSDHHSVFIAQMPGGPCYWHAAFEVLDMDDLLIGHEYLEKRNYDLEWGVGRHVVGSSVFDYWKDPWGHELEHWIDGDRYVRSDGSRVCTVEAFEAVHWGMAVPKKALGQ